MCVGIQLISTWLISAIFNKILHNKVRVKVLGGGHTVLIFVQYHIFPLGSSKNFLCPLNFGSGESGLKC